MLGDDPKQRREQLEPLKPLLVNLLKSKIATVCDAATDAFLALVDVDTGIALTIAEALKGTKHVYASIKALLDKAQPAVDTVAEAAVAREGVKYVVTGKEVDGKEAKQLLAIILEKLEQQVKPQHLPPPPPPAPAPPPPVLSSATAKARHDRCDRHAISRTEQISSALHSEHSPTHLMPPPPHSRRTRRPRPRPRPRRPRRSRAASTR